MENCNLYTKAGCELRQTEIISPALGQEVKTKCAARGNMSKRETVFCLLKTATSNSKEGVQLVRARMPGIACYHKTTQSWQEFAQARGAPMFLWYEWLGAVPHSPDHQNQPGSFQWGAARFLEAPGSVVHNPSHMPRRAKEETL